MAKNPRKGLRAVAIYRNYGGPTAQEERVMVLADGQRQVLQKLLQAEPWRFGDTTEWERRAVMNHFGESFRGLGYDENPLHRLSAFDSLEAQKQNNWTDEEREIVEEAVRKGPGNGVDYIIVDSPVAPRPWPNYDSLRPQGKRTIEMVAQIIADKVVEDGYDPQNVLLYERENENRPEVIAKLEALNGQAPAAEELIEA